MGTGGHHLLKRLNEICERNVWRRRPSISLDIFLPISQPTLGRKPGKHYSLLDLHKKQTVQKTLKNVTKLLKKANKFPDLARTCKDYMLRFDVSVVPPPGDQKLTPSTCRSDACPCVPEPLKWRPQVTRIGLLGLLVQSTVFTLRTGPRSPKVSVLLL